MGREVYILQATMDTRPEDLLITPVIEGEGSLRYVASPLVTAMMRGGIAILDEGNRMSEKSWASLAPLLDNRRYVESIVAGHQDQGASAVPPGGHHERRRLHVRAARVHPFAPAAADLHRLSRSATKSTTSCKENLPFAEERILHYVTDFLQHGARRRRALHRARRHQHRRASPSS